MRRHPEFFEPPAGGRTHAPQGPHRQAGGGSRAQLRGRPRPPPARRTTPARLATGLAAFEASLASSLVRPTPTEQVSSSSSRHPLADGAGDGRTVPEELPRSGDVEERLVERDALDQRRHRFEDVVAAAGSPPCTAGSGRRGRWPMDTGAGLPTTAWPSGPRTCGPRRCRRPRRPGLRSRPRSPGLPGQGRVVEDLDRGEEGVHVDVEDDPLGCDSCRRAPRRPTGPGRSAPAGSATEPQPPEPFGERHPGPAPGVLGAEPHRRRRPFRAVGELAAVAGHRRPLWSMVAETSTQTSGSRVPDSRTSAPGGPGRLRGSSAASRPRATGRRGRPIR